MTKRRWTAKSGCPSCGVTNGCLETPDEQNDDPDGCGGVGTRRWGVVVACIGCGGGERDGAWFIRRRAGTRRQASAADRLRPGHAGAFSALLRNAAGRRVHHPWPHGSRGRPGTAVPESWFDPARRGKTRMFLHANLLPILQARVGDYPNAVAEGGANFWEGFHLVPFSRGFWLDG